MEHLSFDNVFVVVSDILTWLSLDDCENLSQDIAMTLERKNAMAYNEIYNCVSPFARKYGFDMDENEQIVDYLDLLLRIVNRKEN